MSERNLICINCPMGCMLTAVLENGEVTSVSGNTCRRGDEYARKECVAPERTVTGTVRVEGGIAPVISVRTAAPIPKDKVLEAARVMSCTAVNAPIAAGDAVIADLLGTGVALIATRGTEKR